MSSTITRREACEAIDAAVAAALASARLPVLTAAEYASLVNLQTVALLLDLDAAKGIRALLAADKEARGGITRQFLAA